MFKRILLLMMLGFVTFIPTATVSTSTAQEAAVRWYYAFNVDDGSLVAYSLAGETQLLLESGVTGINVIGTRISEDEALLLLRVDEEFGLYHATSEEITLLVGEDGILQVPLATTEGAAVMVNEYAGRAVYAALFRDGVLTRLPNLMFGVRAYARFSQDGRFFRYVGLDETDNIALWQYDTTTGENDKVFDFGVDTPILRVDTYGERWMQRSVVAEGQAAYRIIDLKGDVEELGTYDESQSAGTFHVMGDELVVYPETCESSCSFQLRAADQTQRYSADAATFHSLPVARLTPETLLMLSLDDQFYAVSMDEPPRFIGAFTRDDFHVFSASFQAVSPNQRWLMTVDDGDTPTTHQVHNLTTGEIIATYNYGTGTYLREVNYGDDVVALKLNDNSYDFLLYAPDDAETYEIVHQSRGDNIRVYFTLLPGHQALYRAADPFTGIYLHDLEIGTETPVLAGAWDHIRMLN